MQKIKCYMGIPSTGERADAQFYALRDMEKRFADQIEFVYPDVFVGRIFHDHARNKYVEQFLASDCDVLWFLDSDIVPHHDVLTLITEHYASWDLAGAPYPVFMTPKGGNHPQVIYTAYKRDARGFYPTEIPNNGTDFIDGVATGCLFIKRQVLERLARPYFEFKYDTETRDITEGEDLGFCRKVSDLGYKFFINYGLVCRHFKKVDLLDVNNYAIERANNAVLSFDRSLRQQLLERKLKAQSHPAQPTGLILPR